MDGRYTIHHRLYPCQSVIVALSCHLSDSFNSVIARKSCPIELSMKVVEQDKSRMMDVLHARRAGESSSPSSVPSLHSADKKPDSPSSSHEEWTRFKRPILWMYAGKGPFVSR